MTDQTPSDGTPRHIPVPPPPTRHGAGTPKSAGSTGRADAANGAYAAGAAPEGDHAATASDLTPRQEYRLRQQQRQTVAFTITGLVLAGTMVISLLIGFGILPVPFFNDFSYKPATAQVGSVPCPPESGTAAELDKVQVNVFNGTDRAGLASSAADHLKTAGITVVKVGNSAADDELQGSVRIVTGVRGRQAAYTLAAFFTDPIVILDARKTDTVDLILGEDYESPVPIETAKQKLAGGLEKPKDCLPLTE